MTLLITGYFGHILKRFLNFSPVASSTKWRVFGASEIIHRKEGSSKRRKFGQIITTNWPVGHPKMW